METHKETTEQDRKRTNKTRIGEFFPNPGERHLAEIEKLLNISEINSTKEENERLDWITEQLEKEIRRLELENERLKEIDIDQNARYIQKYGLQAHYEAMKLSASYRCLHIVK